MDRAITALHYAIHKTISCVSLSKEYTWTAHAAVQALIGERRNNTNIQQCWESAAKLTVIDKCMRDAYSVNWSTEEIRQHRKNFRYTMYIVQISYKTLMVMVSISCRITNFMSKL